MRHPSLFGAFAWLLSCTSAASLFAGSNLYYAAGLNQEQQTTLFEALQDANVVWRVWLDDARNFRFIYKRLIDDGQVRTHPRRGLTLSASLVSKVTYLDRTTMRS